MSLLASILLGLMTATTHAGVTVGRGENGRLELSNGLVHLTLTREEGAYRELLRAGDDTGIPVFRSGSSLRADPALMSDLAEVTLSFSDASVLEEGPERGVILLAGDGGGHFVRKTLTLERGSPALQVVVRDSVPGVAELSYLLSTYTFLGAEGRPEFVWTPQLRPDEDDVIADHTFRTPALDTPAWTGFWRPHPGCGKDPAVAFGADERRSPERSAGRRTGLLWRNELAAAIARLLYALR